MDVELAFVRAVLESEGGYREAKKRGVSAGLFSSAHVVRAWEFIDNHVLEFGSVPSVKFLGDKIGLVLDDVDISDGLEVYIKDIKQSATWRQLRAVHERAATCLENRDTEGTIEVLSEGLTEAYRGSAGGRVDNMFALGQEVHDHYMRIKHGVRGVEMPWETMTDATLGWWPGDFGVIVARMGVGKTFCMLMLAHHAWKLKRDVLFVGTEMNRVKLATRLFAIHGQLPYQDLRTGRLNHGNEMKILSVQEEALQEGNSGLYVVGDDFDASIEEIEAAVIEVKPDIVFVDGLYLVKNNGKDRHTRVSNTADDLKRMAKRYQVPIIGSTQFNRDVDPNSRGKISSENIGITDVIGWNADVIYGMYQTEDMQEDGVMGFRPMKLREGSSKDFFVRWDFDSMLFAEGYEDGSDKDPQSGQFRESYFKGDGSGRPDEDWGQSVSGAASEEKPKPSGDWGWEDTDTSDLGF